LYINNFPSKQIPTEVHGKFLGVKHNINSLGCNAPDDFISLENVIRLSYAAKNTTYHSLPGLKPLLRIPQFCPQSIQLFVIHFGKRTPKKRGKSLGARNLHHLFVSLFRRHLHEEKCIIELLVLGAGRGQ
jgi:hypothetical protein